MDQNQNNLLSKIDSFESLFAEAERHPDYWVEGAILEFTDEVLRALRNSGLSRADLADKLGQSRPQVSRLLSGRNNFTIRTMVEVSRALGCRYRSHLQPDGMHSKWVDYILRGRRAKLVAPMASPSRLETDFKPCPMRTAATLRIPNAPTAGTYEELSTAA